MVCTSSVTPYHNLFLLTNILNEIKFEVEGEQMMKTYSEDKVQKVADLVAHGEMGVVVKTLLYTSPKEFVGKCKTAEDFQKLYSEHQDSPALASEIYKEWEKLSFSDFAEAEGSIEKLTEVFRTSPEGSAVELIALTKIFELICFFRLILHHIRRPLGVFFFCLFFYKDNFYSLTF
jgi:hypothetical protein